MKNLLLRSFKLTLWGLFFFYSSKSIYAQKQILFDGELKIYAGYSTVIKVEAVSVVWGIWQDNYPVRSDLRCTYEITEHSCEFDHVGDNNGRPLVGYGRYKITIDNHSTYVDYRDCDYNGPNYPAGYFSPDIEVSYNKDTQTFTKNPSSGNIWNNRYNPWDREISEFKIPVTATNNFANGQIKMNGTNYDTPKTLNWGWTTQNSISVITPQLMEDGHKYVFRKWSDGITSQSRSLTIDDQHNSYAFTANFWWVDMTGPGTLNEYQVGTFIASPVNGVPPYNFTWYKMQYCEGPEEKSGAAPDAPPCDVWIQLSQFNGLSTATASGVAPGFRMKVKVTDTWGVNYQTEMERSVFIGSSAQKPQPPTVTESLVPTDFTLYPAYPNPFNPQTTLRYALPEVSQVILTIYNLHGAAIKTIIQTPQPAGVHSVSWDGTDYQGKIVPAGIYLCQLQAIGTTQKFSQTQKLSLIK